LTEIPGSWMLPGCRDARAVTSPAIFVSSHRQSRLKVVRAARSIQTNPA
jgi:hypothetical protein